MNFKFGNGFKAKDIVTQYEGIIIGRADYLTGCNQYLLSQPVDEKGNYREGRWFDEARIEILEKKIEPETVQGDDPGGPNPYSPAHKV